MKHPKKEEVKTATSDSQKSEDKVVSSSTTETSKPEVAVPSASTAVAERTVADTSDSSVQEPAGEVVEAPSKESLQVSLPVVENASQTLVDTESLQASVDSLSNIDKVTESLQAAYVTTGNRPTRSRFRAVATGTDQNTPPFDISEAIHKPGTDMQRQGYQGKAWLYRDDTLDGTNANSKMLGGVKVYIQWVNGKGFVSPVYYSTTNEDGTFVIDLSEPVVDASGTSHSFQMAGDTKFAIRTWVENPDPAKYNIIQHGDKTYGFHTRTNRKNESWDFTAGVNRIVNSHVILQEKPFTESWLAKPKAEWSEAETVSGEWPESGNYGTLRGNVWYENGDAPGTLANQWIQGGTLPQDKGDQNATGVKVVASYVNDEVARLFDAWKNDNKNYTLDDFAAAQKQIVADYQAANGVGSHIAETVVGVVKADGSYYIPFKGLYGVSRTQQNSGLRISWKISDEEYGKVVSDADVDHNALMKWNGTIGQKHRHINSDYVYAFPLADDYAVWSNNYQTNMFQSTADTLTGAQPAANNFWQNFAILAQQPNHDVLVYDTTDNKATPGTTVESTTSGLMPNRDYQIQWFKNGEPIGAPVTVTADADGRASSVPITVEPDLSAPAVYTSGVFLQGVSTSDISTALALDSFVADVAKQADTLEPKYEDKNVVPGTPATSTPALTDKDGNPATAPAGTKFAIAPDFTAPEGYTVAIDENTGVVTVTAPASPTATTAETVEVPVVVTYPDASVDQVKANFYLDTDGDNTPDKDDADDDNDGIPDTNEGTDGTNPKDPNSAAASITPIDDQTVEQGSPIKDVPVAAQKVPTGGSLKVEGLPEGVSFDPTTNTISGTPTTAGESTVTVTVLDKEGNPVKDAQGNPVTEEFKITVTEATKAADTLEPKYEDKNVVPGTPATSTPALTDKDGNPATAPAGTKFAIAPDYTAPEGYTVAIDENTGVVTVTAPASPTATTAETVEVPVVVTYPDASVDQVKANFYLDTDGDNTPDKDDADDDNDGIPDTNEGTDGTNPKDPNSAAASITPIDDQTVEQGSPIKDVPVAAQKVPTGGSLKVEGLPEGVSFDPTTNTISGTPTTAGESTVTVTVLDKEGNPVKDAQGNPVTEEFKITVTEATKAADTLEPKYEDKNVVPGTPATSTPALTDKDGNPATAPAGTKFAIAPDYTAPEGYTVAIDENTGVVTVTAPASPTATTAETVEVPVVVTYPDASVDQVKANFYLDTDGDNTPDKDDADDDNDGIPDTNEGTDGTNPKDPNSAAASITPIDDQTVEQGSPIKDVPVAAQKVPTGGSLKVDGLPEGVSFDPTTNTISGTPTTAGESTVTVTVLDKDGNPVKDAQGNPVTEEFKITVTEPEKEADRNEPAPVVQTVKVGDQVDPAKSISNVDELPKDAKITFETPVDTSQPGDQQAMVVVTYPDGSEDKVPVTVKVEENPKQADTNEPAPVVQTVKVGDQVDPAKSISNVDELPKDAKITFETPVDTSQPGDQQVMVVVTYPDGSEDKVPVTVKVEENPTQAATNEPAPAEQVVKVGETPSAEESISNLAELPADTKVEFETPVDTSQPGDKPAMVVVTYPDGSQ
ncbi:YPDG domain-containing protein, partial [Streptococcus danieliae]